MKKLIYVLGILLMLYGVVYAAPPAPPCKVRGSATTGYTLPGNLTISGSVSTASDPTNGSFLDLANNVNLIPGVSSVDFGLYFKNNLPWVRLVGYTTDSYVDIPIYGASLLYRLNTAGAAASPYLALASSSESSFWDASFSDSGTATLRNTQVSGIVFEKYLRFATPATASKTELAFLGGSGTTTPFIDCTKPLVIGFDLRISNPVTAATDAEMTFEISRAFGVQSDYIRLKSVSGGGDAGKNLYFNSRNNSGTQQISLIDTDCTVWKTYLFIIRGTYFTVYQNGVPVVWNGKSAVTSGGSTHTLKDYSTWATAPLIWFYALNGATATAAYIDIKNMFVMQE